MNAAFYPVDFPPERLAATIGLLSDTHLPDRRRALPPVLSTIFEGVDLLLHAGDVGELRVLDELSRIAPVIAVHGNDDTAEAQQELPERQLLSVAGRRLLLWHSHHPDRASELELRKDDAWAPKLERVRERGRQAGATLVVFGHIHVPLQQEEDGILLINPAPSPPATILPGSDYRQSPCSSCATTAVPPCATWTSACRIGHLFPRWTGHPASAGH